MLSLAPMKYAKVLSQHDGPVKRLEYASTNVLGIDCTQAVAYLREDLVPESVRPKTRTAQPDGAGSHQSAQIACHMAVSEALERWAVFHCRAHPESARCAMEIDGSSNGFAAYPGLFKRQARMAAFRESIERHCLISWWEGLVAHRPLADPQMEMRAIELDNPFSRHSVVVIWSRHNGRHSIAFGAGKSFKHATWRASVELERTQMLIDRIDQHKEKHPDLPLTDLFERRIDYFASEEGFSKFLQRLDRGPVGSAPELKWLFDAPVPGPWDRYATVWRTVIEPPNRDYLSDSADYFFW